MTDIVGLERMLPHDFSGSNDPELFMRVMSRSMSQSFAVPDEARLRDANISPKTLLATDYLNHFNEVLMLIEMLPTMPDCVDDILAWRPMSYGDYFSQSTFKEKRLAIGLYDAISPALKERFEALVTEINGKVTGLIEQLPPPGQTADGSMLDMLAFSASSEVRPLIDRVSALINGHHADVDWMLAVDHPTAQDEIDRLFD